MATTIKIFKKNDDLGHFFAIMLANGIKEIPEGNFFSIALSGGSTPKQVFSYIASDFKNIIDWKKVLVFWSDERCVPVESDDSNYRMAAESFLNHIPLPASNIYRIKGEADPIAEAVRYGEAVRQHVPSVNHIPRFDLIMLGIGEDGHTASIFPGNLNILGSDNLFEVAENPYTMQIRITATGKLINNAKSVVFLATGDSKSEIVSRVIGKKKGWEKLPASSVHPSEGNLFWLLDGKSASLLVR
jgi:6-phosphogluconolactonase